MLNFDILDKALGIVSPAHILYDFSTKMFLPLYSINRPNFIAWLPSLLDILDSMCIAIDCLFYLFQLFNQHQPNGKK